MSRLHRRVWTLVVIALLASTTPARSSQSGSPRALDADIVARINAVFTRFGNATPGAALAVARDGEIIYEAGYGIANLEYDIPITPASSFHVASISKQFTAMAVVLLALDGKLSLDDDIRDYIPEVPDFGATITIRHLMTHTSGLRDQWNLLSLAGWRSDDTKTQDDILDLVSRQRELNFEPGAEYLYCNTGFTLLAILVDRVAGQPMKDFARARIFEPLGMNDTHFHDDIGHIVKGRTYAYSPRGDDFRINIPDFANYGATSLFTTAGDLTRWASNFAHERIGGERGVAMLLERGVLNDGDTIDYALGVQHGSYRGLRTIGHGGSDAGYRAQLTIFPDQQLSIVVLSNLSNGNPGGLAREVADVLLADELTEDLGEREPGSRPERTTQELTEAELAKFTGKYHSAELDVIYEIVLQDGALVLERRKFEGRRLVPSGEDSFAGFNSIDFTRDASGRIDGFVISTGRVRNLRFARID